jgi:hypothetical protein
VKPGGTDAREKVTKLNLRHSLCIALIAARAAGLGHWPDAIDTSRNPLAAAPLRSPPQSRVP